MLWISVFFFFLYCEDTKLWILSHVSCTAPLYIVKFYVQLTLKWHVLLVTSYTILFTNGAVSSFKELNPEHDMLCSFKPLVIIFMYCACKYNCEAKKCHTVPFQENRKFLSSQTCSLKQLLQIFKNGCNT